LLFLALKPSGLTMLDSVPLFQVDKGLALF
jgi:hypothetical protein